MTRTIPAPANGPDRERTVALHRLVRHLVADGDARAAKAGRRARRTLSEMETVR
ncbi:hypothetical protein HUT15_36960 (plasmid) [Streptomyces sp. NA03103]|uniref:hypothetical protein n=1 Tax=unclassified Streptomyces TaxID=2593676 RepID=UPI0015921AA1|nr:hypothetical protein [Streptomyces sp. NA03103]QKW66060.1 hypothetical protein HUT15_36960 [Streptomyces sp. NA03103]